MKRKIITENKLKKELRTYLKETRGDVENADNEELDTSLFFSIEDIVYYMREYDLKK